MKWLTNEILTGFQKLLCLGLERQPAAEVLPGTAQVWVEALTNGRVWDETRDRPRARQAFVTMAKTRTTWPAPKDFIEALPQSTQPALKKEVRVSASDVVARAARELGRDLKDSQRAEGQPQ